MAPDKWGSNTAVGLGKTIISEVIASEREPVAELIGTRHSLALRKPSPRQDPLTMKTKTFFVVAAYVAVLSCTSHAQAQLTTKPKNLVYVCTMPSAGRFSFNVTGPAS